MSDLPHTKQKGTNVSDTPSRSLQLPPRKRQSASGLIKSQAAAEREVEQKAPVAEAQNVPKVPKVPNVPNKAAKAPSKSVAAAYPRAEGKIRTAVDLPAQLRGRANTAFKYAKFHEGTTSFSAFVASALEVAVRRMEQEYNGGAEFTPDEDNLRPGRPAGS